MCESNELARTSSSLRFSVFSAQSGMRVGVISCWRVPILSAVRVTREIVLHHSQRQPQQGDQNHFINYRGFFQISGLRNRYGVYGVGPATHLSMRSFDIIWHQWGRRLPGVSLGRYQEFLGYLESMWWSSVLLNQRGLPGNWGR